MSEDFSLVTLIRKVCSEHAGELSNGKVEHEVLIQIADEDVQEALRQALRYAVKEEISKVRRGTSIRPVGALTERPAPAQVPVPALAIARPLAVPLPAPQPVRSRKVSAIREVGEQWRKSLEERYSIGNNITAPLGDLTRDQLLMNISIREEHARRSAARATQLRGLLDLFDRHDVSRVRDLPETVLASILTRSAA